jgi:tetratricopeptide (TPR) repeat protein
MVLNEFALRRHAPCLPSPPVNGFCKLRLLASLFLAGGLVALAPSSAAQENEPDIAQPAVVVDVPTNAPSTNAPSESDMQLLRNFLLLQEQLRTTQRAVEEAREKAEAESKQQADLLTARLNLIEQTLHIQRQQEMDALQRATRTMLTVVGVITGVGFLAVIFAGLVQVRAMTRLSDISRQLQLALPPPPRFPELGPGSIPAGHEAVEAANANLLGAIARLEKRLEDVEEAATPGTHTATNGHKQIAAPLASSSNPSVVTILGKGQALLNLNKAEEALEHFEQALEIDPRNVEAWIKKGTALERLQRVEDAIQAYDQAIATDSSTATAYLFKAGVYNRQKKYAEALQCYEKALSVQQRARTGTQVSKA